MSAGKQDAQLIRQFILSLDMLHQMDKTLGLREHYESTDIDFLSRLWQWESQEDFLEYYHKHVTVIYDELSGTLTIRARSFYPGICPEDRSDITPTERAVY